MQQEEWSELMNQGPSQYPSSLKHHQYSKHHLLQ